MSFTAPVSSSAERLMRVEQALAETQAVLAKILPDFVIERLKAAPGQPIIDTYDNASVLFADITGFVGISKRLGGERTVKLLNQLIREFDELATLHGVEKIKTMGDGYMAVSGVPRTSADHCQRLARLALDMQTAAERASKRTGVTIKLRIGIAAGPVMAGVIGFNKFAYDIWGDTVNHASRLEKMAPSGQILLSEEANKQLGSSFFTRARGSTQIRGLGKRQTWVLDGEGALH
ncbi:Adenylate cyclase (fragment) [Candidatus Filomicrobium marinum]|uniref:Adenylate cyclase n=2 Tax=Filomicrobium TaxID=119044 RepID=A0A0D6JCP9_9HYPH